MFRAAGSCPISHPGIFCFCFLLQETHLDFRLLPVVRWCSKSRSQPQVGSRTFCADPSTRRPRAAMPSPCLTHTLLSPPSNQPFTPFPLPLSFPLPFFLKGGLFFHFSFLLCRSLSSPQFFFFSIITPKAQTTLALVPPPPLFFFAEKLPFFPLTFSRYSTRVLIPFFPTR